MKRIYLLLYVSALLFVSVISQAQTLLPRPEPPRAVNDFTGILSSAGEQALEEKLRSFNDTTSNAIVIVMVNDLQGYDRSDFAYLIGKEWGVGRADFNNGIVVLVKPKTDESSGLAFIATGSGLEGAIPDLACADIIDREMIPHFRENDYYGGLEAGTNVLMALASGEYNYDNYRKDTPGGAIPAGLIFIIIIIVIALAASGNSNNRHLKKSGTSNLPLWILLSMMGSGKSHGGSWGGFSGGGGGFSGGGGGGFGGFGGGGFGGGGAGGSW